MHRYLRAVGLKSLDSKKKVRNFLDGIIENPDTTHIVQDGPESNIAVLTKRFTDRAGIAVCGEFEERDLFRMDSYFPYVTSEELSTYVTCSVGKMAGSDGYSGMCEDYRLGVSLIFFLVNFMSRWEGSGKERSICDVCISGLADEGKILLPVQKTKEERAKARFASLERGQMIEEARNGNSEAMEKLTFDEMSLHNTISRRIRREDLYSLVDTFFMPSGMECDQYALMGEITEVNSWRNSITGETGYYLMVECNDMPILISINKSDLLGEPMVGYRFKGNAWIQGTANYI